jgi:hypothetical protein
LFIALYVASYVRLYTGLPIVYQPASTDRNC